MGHSFGHTIFENQPKKLNCLNNFYALLISKALTEESYIQFWHTWFLLDKQKL